MSKPNPKDFLGASVLNLPTGASATIDNGKVSISGLSETIKSAELISYTRTAYTAGTAGVNDYDLAGITIANGTKYLFRFSKTGVLNQSSVVTDSVTDQRSYIISVADGHTEATVRAALIVAINADASAWFSAVDNASKVRVTADAAAFGELLAQKPAGTVTTNITPHVFPSGASAEVETFKPGSTVGAATGLYTKYVISFNRDKRNDFVSGAIVKNNVKVIVWADEGAAAYADFDSVIGGVFGVVKRKIAVTMGTGDAEWVRTSTIGAMTLAASQTSKVLAIPIDGLKVGDKILRYRVLGQVESGGNVVTVDATLRTTTLAAADLADALVAGSAITQVSETADAIVDAEGTPTDPVAVLEDVLYQVQIDGTTAAATDIAISLVEVDVQTRY